MGDLSILQATLYFPLLWGFAGRGGAVSGPQRRRFIFTGGGLGARLRLPVLPPCEVGQRRASATCVDFFMPTAFGVSIARSRTSGLGKKPEHLEAALPPS